MADPESFVRRWSRRKSAAREQAREPVPAAALDGGTAAPAPELQAPARPAPAETEPAFDPQSLPDVESLTYESDFTVFMRKGVPAELRRLALQRLWRSNPALANLDGLLEYGEDYTKIGTTKSLVRTAYRVGRGMLSASETLEEAAQAAGPAAAPAADAGAAETAAADADPPPPKTPGAERG